MKRYFNLGLAVMLLISFLACQGKSSDSSSKQESDNADQTTTEEKTDQTTTEEKTDETTTEKTKPDKQFTWKEAPQASDIPDQPVSGTVTGEEFKSIYAQVDEDGDKTILYFSAKKPESTCKGISNGMKAKMVSVEISGRLKEGTFTTSTEESVSATIYTEEDRDFNYAGYALVVESLSSNELKGKIAICFTDDAKSFVSGTFTAEYCETRVIPTEEPPLVNGVTWSMDKYEESAIPDTPVQANFLGTPMDIQYIEIKDKGEEYSLSFSNKKPEEPCGFTSDEDELIIYSSKPLATGTFIGNWDDETFKENWHMWFSYPQNHDRGTMSNNPGWNLALTISNIDKENKKVTGKVIGVYKDESKTMVAGSFEADYCASDY